MVLLITDVLEREGTTPLEVEMVRLVLQARWLTRLNQLLRWDQFSTQAAGICATLSHVLFFAACRNLDSLQELSDGLGDGFSSDYKKRLKGLL